MSFRSLLLFLTFVPSTWQKCVWYGECNRIDTKIQNCLSEDGESHPLKYQESIEILKQKCPMFANQVTEKQFCCNDNQVQTMGRKTEYAAGMFQRCPTCIANLNEHICHLICSPNQTDFVEAEDVREGGSINGGKYIMKVKVHLSKQYKEQTFDSCKEVTSPSSGEKAMKMACGVWGAADQCTPDRWFEFFGSMKDNMLADFWIDYNPPENDSFKTLHLDALPCNVSYESKYPCSCSDCEASCTIPFEHSETQDPFMIGQMYGVDVIMCVVFGVSSIVVLMLLHRHHRKSSISVFEKETSEQKKKHFLEKTGNKIKILLSQTFTVWATYCARNPTLVFAISSWVIAVLGYGMYNLKITTDPTEIWASPSCKSRLDKTYFDSRFTPFYRTNQIFIKSKGLKSFNWTNSDNFTYTFGPAFNSDFLYEVYKLQMQIQQLGVEEGKGLEKICFSPMKNEFFNDNSTKYCAIQSVWGYLNNDASILNNTYQLYNTLQICVRNNFDPTCLAPYGGPIFSPLAVGGQQEIETDDPFQNKYLLATGVSLTFLVNNALNVEQIESAFEWEKKFIDFLKNWKENSQPEFMEIAFSAERSIQDEIERESKAEMTTIIISYFVMFVYITVSLGRIRSVSSLLLDSKATLGIGGIVIVLASVIASLGVFGYLGISTTLLTIEVIPFLVLAVGVDNIFILVHTYQQLRETKGGETEELIGLALGNVGPSILLTSTSEAACFFIGTLSDMPAIKTFAEYSSLAIIFNFLLQISCFVSLIAVDSRRQKNNYADIFCCVKVKQTEPQQNASNLLFLLFKNYYGPFLLKTKVRILVIMVFLFWLCFSISCIFHIEKGLDQELSMPEDSYVIDYFQFMKDLFSMGPPVYFVLKNGLNYTNPIEVNAVCGTVGCDSDSLVTYLTRASRLSNISYIAKSPSSWIDDYFDWLSSPQCCKLFTENNSFCPHQISECESCEVRIENWRPRQNDFKKYLPFFLNDNPDIECPKAGHAAYAGGVNFEMNQLGQLQVTDNYFMAYHTPLITSKDFYMALKNSREIADHLSMILTKKLNRTIEVFPYSIFYVYYEQYLTIVEDAALSLSLSLLAVFGVTFLFTGFDLRSACLVGLVVTSMLINMTAMLHWWSITLNAVSLVNLLVAVGIGVEFCSHIVHAFVSSSEPDKMSKALDTISTMGSSADRINKKTFVQNTANKLWAVFDEIPSLRHPHSKQVILFSASVFVQACMHLMYAMLIVVFARWALIAITLSLYFLQNHSSHLYYVIAPPPSGFLVFSGITLTKFLGIVVLAFAQTLMLRIFYFRMYLGIVVMGAAHGLVLMPVLLSYFG